MRAFLCHFQIIWKGNLLKVLFRGIELAFFDIHVKYLGKTVGLAAVSQICKISTVCSIYLSITKSHTLSVTRNIEKFGYEEIFLIKLC